jgi:hypothetical protein
MIQLFYYPFKTSLQHDIRARKESLSHYDPHRIWYFMFVLLRVADAFEKCGIHLGNLHPSNLFQELSVFSLLSEPNELSNLDKIRSSKYEDAFLGTASTTQPLNRFKSWSKNRQRLRKAAERIVSASVLSSSPPYS